MNKLIILSLLLIITIIKCEIKLTALDRYVNKPDSNYQYNLVNKITQKPDLTGYVLNMTSQKWLTSSDSSNTIWTHFLVIWVPKVIKTSKLALWIGGGTIGSEPTKEDGKASELARKTGIVTGFLHGIPNEPITFYSDPDLKHRTEDAMIAFTWKHYIDHQDEPEWIAQLPMTKAAVRALDTMDDFVPNHLGLPLPQGKRYFVSGASKRGGITWLTGAVEYNSGRLIGIIPIEWNSLNFVIAINRQWQAYGEWSFALQDYTNQNITDYLNKPQVAKLMTIVDPLSYSERYANLPKYAIGSTGDEFFLLDDSVRGVDLLEGETHWRIVQNTEHAMVGKLQNVLNACSGWISSFLVNSTRPNLSWEIDYEAGNITFHTDIKPTKIETWSAPTWSNTYRDFRYISEVWPPVVEPILWEAKPLALTSYNNGIYTYVSHQNPNRNRHKDGWLGFFVEAMFADGSKYDMKFTSDVAIIPNTMPFPPCSPGNGC